MCPKYMILIMIIIIDHSGRHKAWQHQPKPFSAHNIGFLRPTQTCRSLRPAKGTLRPIRGQLRPTRSPSEQHRALSGRCNALLDRKGPSCPERRLFQTITRTFPANIETYAKRSPQTERWSFQADKEPSQADKLSSGPTKAPQADEEP